jgi:hypothetical protein
MNIWSASLNTIDAAAAAAASIDVWLTIHNWESSNLDGKEPWLTLTGPKKIWSAILYIWKIRSTYELFD